MNGTIKFEAELEKGDYTGTEEFARWESHEELIIVICPPINCGRLKSFNFTGSARFPNPWEVIKLQFSTKFIPPVVINPEPLAPFQ